MPRVLAQWFAGTYVPPAGGPPWPWKARIAPWWAMLPHWWDCWHGEHPEARPPAGFEWLADPTSPKRRSPAWQVAEARRVLGLPAL